MFQLTFSAIFLGGLLFLSSVFGVEPTNRPDRVLADFDGSDYSDWEVIGTAFGSRPAGRKDSTRPTVTGFSGVGYASSAVKGSNPGGRLRSPLFTIDRRYINFLIGGDKFTNTSIRIIIDGEAVRVVPGMIKGVLRPWSLDLAEFQGRQARIEILDAREVGKSDQPIYVDQITLSDESSLITIDRTIPVNGNYLNLPIGIGEGQSPLQVEVDGILVRKSNILAPLKAPYESWVSHRVDDLRGKSARIVIENVPRESHLEDFISISDEPHDGKAVYREPLRPQFHFSTRNGWLNDPNGLVYLDGEWHLFYQHNAFGLLIGNQSWGHAISRDLVHWEELPVVLQPYVFSQGKSYSGSAVVDKKNRTGLNTGSSPLLLAYYTDTGYAPRAECLAYSTDHGRSFHYYKGNPLVQHRSDGRDPKVFWYPIEDTDQKDGHWVMVVFSKNGEQNGLRILISENGLNWEETDWLPDYYECPELFRLPIRDEKGQPTADFRWILSGGDGKYAIGQFDGRTFRTDQIVKLQTVHQPAYAGQCFNDAPDGRVIQISWLRRHLNWKDMPFSQMMSVPLELTLHQHPNGLRIHANPVKELATLRAKSFEQHEMVLSPGDSLPIPLQGQLYDLELTFTAPKEASVKIHIGEDIINVTGDGKIEEVDTDISDGKFQLRVLVDRPSIEVIANHGLVYLPKPRTSPGQNISLSISAEGKPVEIQEVRAYELNSIWQ